MVRVDPKMLHAECYMLTTDYYNEPRTQKKDTVVTDKRSEDSAG